MYIGVDDLKYWHVLSSESSQRFKFDKDLNPFSIDRVYKMQRTLTFNFKTVKILFIYS